MEAHPLRRIPVNHLGEIPAVASPACVAAADCRPEGHVDEYPFNRILEYLRQLGLVEGQCLRGIGAGEVVASIVVVAHVVNNPRPGETPRTVVVVDCRVVRHGHNPLPAKP